MKIKIIRSFKYAFRGLGVALQEQTIRILCFFALLVIGLMTYLGVSFIEKTVIILTITVVFSLELINSQVEKTLDIVKPEFSEKVREIKDISAAAVLVAGIGAMLVGIVIFLPYILSLLGLR